MTEAVFQDKPYLREIEANVLGVRDNAVVLDKTVFYPLGGGQPGDTGELRSADGRRWRVTDTRKDRESGEILHVIEGNDLPEAGLTVTAEIDWPQRHRYMRMHTCLHLLSAVITAPVTGGQIGDGYGRLDFDLPETPDIESVETALNELIRANHHVNIGWITDAELDANPELVKTLSVQPPRGAGRVRLVDIPGVDRQPCGGTHVASTGEIGPVRVAKIEKKGKQNRRVRLEFA